MWINCRGAAAETGDGASACAAGFGIKECRDADYEKRLKAAYPIHHEIFDRLRDDCASMIRTSNCPRRIKSRCVSAP
jgi:hypothetical protein